MEIVVDKWSQSHIDYHHSLQCRSGYEIRFNIGPKYQQSVNSMPLLLPWLFQQPGIATPCGASTTRNSQIQKDTGGDARIQRDEEVFRSTSVISVSKSGRIQWRSMTIKKKYINVWQFMLHNATNPNSFKSITPLDP